jgi:hypothetical protein
MAIYGAVRGKESVFEKTKPGYSLLRKNIPGHRHLHIVP